MYELIANLNKSGITIIMISHDLNTAGQYASHVLHLGGRGVLFHGTIADWKEKQGG
jgi:zinc transport system ATP-binding protein